MMDVKNLAYILPVSFPNSGAKLGLLGVVAIVSVFVLSIWASTEYVAYKTQWNPMLGPALFWKIYAPWMVGIWFWQFWATPGTIDMWMTAEHIFLFGHVIGGALGFGMYVLYRDSRFGGETDMHGSARFATDGEVKKTGLLGDGGVYVGAYQEKKSLRYLRHNGPEHVAVIAPGRSGKGASTVIPTALSWDQSLMAYDIKGEIWEHSAGWRANVLKSKCVKFDPTNRDGSSASWNPLLEVRAWPDDVRDVQLITHAIINPQVKGVDSDHWKLTGRSFLSGLILHQLYAGHTKSFAGCYRILTTPNRLTQLEILRNIAQTEHDPHGIYQWTDPETRQPTRTHPVVASAMQAVINMSDRERPSVISTALSHFELYTDPIIAENTTKSDFTLADFLEEQTQLSLYLVTPPSDIERTAPLFRTFIMLTMQRLTEQLNAENGVARKRILFLLDEVKSLGSLLPYLAEQLAHLAGYGVTCCLILQDLSQLEKEQSAILANCHVQVVYAPNSMETAKYISQRLGDRTVLKPQRTYTGRRWSLWLPHVISSDQESKRRLRTEDEILRMPEDEAILFIGNQNPILGKKIRYYQDAEFCKRANIPAPATSDVLPSRHTPWGRTTPEVTPIVIPPGIRDLL